MKNTWKILAGLLMVTGLVYYSGCVKGDFDEPPIYVPTVDFEANTSIAALKASFTTFRQIEEDIVIEGVVVANDEAGNLFKKLVIQDETAGIELSLDRYNLYNQFKLGQRVLVKCQGMYIGHYNNLMQLGYTFNDDIGRLPEPLIDQHVFRDSLAGAKPEPKEITLGSLTDLTNDNLARLDSAVSTLVRFKDVRFTDADAGQPWVKPDEDNTNRTIIDGSNNSLIIRTSRFSNFAYESTPYGFGEITGVLSVFRTTWQLTIRDLDDVNDFTGIIPDPPGGGTGTFEDPFDVTSAIEQQNENPYVIGWVKGYIVGSVKAGTSSIGSSGDIDFSAPFSSATNVLLAENASVTDYMNCVVVNLPAGTPLRSQVNLLDNPDNLGKELNVNGTLRTYFGIAGLRDSNGTTADFELEDNGGGGGGTFIFQEVFAADLGVFTAFSVAGAQAWGWGSFDGGCAVMSGYDQGTNYANEDWLVSPAISLAGESGVVLNIREAINYITSYDDMQVLISTDYDGSSDPSTNGTWTEQSEFNRPAGNSWTFVDSGDISLAAYEGQTIYIAFKYLSTSDGSATWEISRVEVK
jgi:hypothetical protein